MITSQELGKEFLSHYGVKGMKWGVRRSAAQLAKARRTAKKTRYKTSPKELDDDELNRRIKRLELEKKYNELNAGSVRQGAKYTQTILSNSGKGAAGAAVGGTVSFFVGRALRNRYGANS